MLNITQLNCSLWSRPTVEIGKGVTQQEAILHAESAVRQTLMDPKPTVVWRVTRLCNLHCLNCLSDAQARCHAVEVTTEEGKGLIRDLAAFGVQRLVFAGGEPLLRKDLPELVAYARQKGLQPSLLSNGTLLTPANATRLMGAGLHSAGMLLEGMDRDVDRLRTVPGSFRATLDGYASCHAAGVNTEMRVPLTRWNFPQLTGILDSLERWQVRRVVFAHMVYAGRGNRPQDDLTHEEKRRALDLILARAEDSRRRGARIQIATDENHTDAVYFYLRLAGGNPARAEKALRLLPAYGAHVQGAGVGAAGIDAMGNVHPDQYWSNYILGNVRQIPFSAIWGTSPDPLLQGLRHRLPLLRGRCGHCRWKPTCGGNLRVRAGQFYGDPWTSDPACYLTNKEISKEVTEEIETMEDDVLLSEQAA